MKDYKINTYDEAVQVIKEVGILPLSPLIPQYPSLDSITLKDHWYTGTELDPWQWRAQFAVDGVAAYGKFIKKKSILISRDFLPFIKAILGNKQTIKGRYEDGMVSKEALELFTLIHEEEGIDTRVLRVKAGMKDKEKKKLFDNGLLELQGSMDIVISGTKEKQNENGEKNGWSSTSYETMENWTRKNHLEEMNIPIDEAKEIVKKHFNRICSSESIKTINKLFKL